MEVGSGKEKGLEGEASIGKERKGKRRSGEEEGGEVGTGMERGIRGEMGKEN